MTKMNEYERRKKLNTTFLAHSIIRENQMGKENIDPLVHSTPFETKNRDGNKDNLHEFHQWQTASVIITKTTPSIHIQ
jgi:hypothetical protein